MTTEPSQAYVTEYLQAADESLQEARVLLDRALLKGAVSRAYYAIFYAAQAALISQQVPLPKRHRTVITLFYRHFIEPGKVPRELHRDLVRSFQLRQQSDYEIHAQIGEIDVNETIRKAEAFIASMRRLVGLAQSKP